MKTDAACGAALPSRVKPSVTSLRPIVPVQVRFFAIDFDGTSPTFWLPAAALALGEGDAVAETV